MNTRYSIEDEDIHECIMEFYYPYVNVYGEDNTTEEEIILKDLRYMSLDEFRTSKDEFTNYDYACVAIKIRFDFIVICYLVEKLNIIFLYKITIFYNLFL